jgi:hypothetical protein
MLCYAIGKTTVVGPLLALLLADGETLIVQTMPPALLEQSRATLRATFSLVVKKRVFTIAFDRSSRMTWSTVDKLRGAVRNRGVVLATSATIKSIMLKTLEHMDLLRDTRRPQPPAAEHSVRALVDVLRLLGRGLVVMDEVDLILHPLKAELNFPLRDKLPLDFSPERWTCAIHALDGIFCHETAALASGLQQSTRAARLLAQLQACISAGYERRALQRSPHLTLLDIEWYTREMQPLMAEWMLLWLEANHMVGLSRTQALAYILADGTRLAGHKWEPEIEAAANGARGQGDASLPQTEGAAALNRLHAFCNARLDRKTFRLLNLASSWLRTFLPHVIAKINRVSYGLLSEEEHKRLLKQEPMMPRSRFKLAVPFVGKDVPSRASEFAHPDIIVGLTICAYRYEGLRRTDFENDVIGSLRAEFEKEVGPFKQRQSSQLYESWVHQAGGVVKGSERDTKDGADGRTLVVPLYLLKQSNDEQLLGLYQLLRKSPPAVHWLLQEVIFPVYLQHQVVKLSACGQELGGDVIFGKRIGFSGTPSDLLPLDLGTCGFEKGSDGKMVRFLTDPSICSLESAPAGWTVTSLLQQIAAAEPRFHALIDTGALITGLSNRAVAEFLLATGHLEWCEGVVFLDDDDDKVVLMKATGRVVALSQCGIALENRFCFYDQIHTTGMDISHSLSARAALTLGKDMVFRDLAQGAFRMRGIGEGQRVVLLCVPEVATLMQRELAKAGRDSGTSDASPRRALNDVVMWLTINSMRSEEVQFNQLSGQNLANIYRKSWRPPQNPRPARRRRLPPSRAVSFVPQMPSRAWSTDTSASALVPMRCSASLPRCSATPSSPARRAMSGRRRLTARWSRCCSAPGTTPAHCAARCKTLARSAAAAASAASRSSGCPSLARRTQPSSRSSRACPSSRFRRRISHASSSCTSSSIRYPPPARVWCCFRPPGACLHGTAARSSRLPRQSDSARRHAPPTRRRSNSTVTRCSGASCSATSLVHA